MYASKLIMNPARRAAEQFVPAETIVAVDEFGNGNINDTYLVRTTLQNQGRFILQRINTYVFRRPKLIIENLRTCITHIQGKMMQQSRPPSHRWEMPRLRATKTGKAYYIDADDSFWRAISFVDRSCTLETIQDQTHAREVGYALGYFHALLSDLNTDKLHDTLPGFHIVPQYLAQYDQVKPQSSPTDSSPETRYCHAMIETRRAWASVLEDAKVRGDLPERNIHGDPKVNNIMICKQTGQAVSMVDLDTVKPGLIHYDLGDCLRSSCNPLGEETGDFDHVRFEIDLAEPILEGYLASAAAFLTPSDYDFIYDSVRLIAFEMGLRFFQDHLAGNVYFKVEHDEHNLNRAMVQFKLLESIEAQQQIIQALIDDLEMEKKLNFSSVQAQST